MDTHVNAVISHTTPSRFSACNIEKVGIGSRDKATLYLSFISSCIHPRTSLGVHVILIIITKSR